MTIHRNSTEAFVKEAATILSRGRPAYPRGKETLERLNATITLALPNERCYVLKHRNNNVFAQIAETLWMLRGRDDIEWLSYYLPRAPQFSDNGRTWRGAYGPRLRNWNGANAKVDQVKYAMDAIKSDPLTRQAVISIWDASIDDMPGKDIPCNNWLHFIQRGNRLIMNVAQRSSDVLWGYSGIDTFSWSVLHEMMAFWTGHNLGTFTHFISSFHLYTEYQSRISNIVRSWIAAEDHSMYQYGITSIPFSTPFEKLDTELDRIFALEANARAGKVINLWGDIGAIEDAFLRACAQMLYIYSMLSQESIDVIMAYINQLPEQSDFRIAALEYVHRAKDWNVWDKLTKDDRWVLSKYVVIAGK